MATQPKLVSLAVAADFIAVNPKTIRRRISDGTIKAYRFGPRVLRVDLDEITKKLRPIPTGGGHAA